MRSISVKRTASGYVQATFQAAVDAVIPPVFQGSGGSIQIVGAAQLGVHKYVIRQLDHSQFIPVGMPVEPLMSLSMSTAVMLDAGAEELVHIGAMTDPVSRMLYPEGGTFSALSRINRLKAIALINQLAIPIHALPFPYQNNPGLIQTMMESLHQLTMFGYYSEWFGYGRTRCLPPEEQRVECFPPGWRMSGYPGPSFGYRGLRGFLLKYPHQKGADGYE
ncbi:hypothetical protein [Paenibacillus nanensis]|uniref:hypothetical protein n=1 Tax=Paenibacillus nanensis TaxID=393251 RepID=UPI001F0BB99A|nr:hypothetical protein [Paenibacillus nanensis]